MALFGRKKPTPVDTNGWTPAVIQIVTASRPLDRSQGGSSGVLGDLVDWATDAAGTPYSFDLRVQPDGMDAYRIAHEERVPSSVTRGPIGQGDVKIPDGLEVTGWVDPGDATKIRIDWSGFNKSPESKAAVAEAGQGEYDHTYAQQLAKMPAKQVEQLKSNAAMSAAMLAPMVKAGQVPRADFDTEVLMNLRRGLLTQEQYDAAVAVAEGRA